MHIESYKVTEGNFDINLTPGEVNGVRLHLKDGEVCISISGILLNGGGLWYELPLRDIVSVEVAEEDPFKLKFVLEDVEVEIHGKNSAQLRALRHFLMPFLHNENN